MPELIFTCDGYDFYRDDMAFWGVAREGEKAPTHCGYATPEPIAKLKGCDLRNIQWSPIAG